MKSTVRKTSKAKQKLSKKLNHPKAVNGERKLIKLMNRKTKKVIARKKLELELQLNT